MIVLSVAGWPVYALLSCIKEFVKIKSGIMSQCFNSPLFSSLVVLSLAIYTFFRLINNMTAPAPVKNKERVNLSNKEKEIFWNIMKNCDDGKVCFL